MAGVVTPVLEFDPDRDGTWTDITAYANLEGTVFSLTRKNPYEGGFSTSSFDVVLRNTNDYFSLRNSSSSLSTYPKSRIPIRLKVDGAVKWSGVIVTFKYTYDLGKDVGTVKFSCQDILSTIMNASVYIDPVFNELPIDSTSISGDGAIQKIFSYLGIASGDIDLTAFNKAFPVFFSNNERFSSLLQTALLCEPGYMYTASDGKITLKPYSYYNGVKSAPTLRSWGEYSTANSDGTYTVMPYHIDEDVEDRFATAAEVSTNSYTFDGSASAPKGIIYRATVGNNSADKLGRALEANKPWIFIIEPNIEGVTGWTGDLECVPGRDIMASTTSDIADEDLDVTAVNITVSFSDDKQVTVTNISASTTYYITRLEIRGVPIFNNSTSFNYLSPKSPTAATSSAVGSGTGGTAWIGTSEALDDDGSFASVTLSAAAEHSEYLELSDFEFDTIPFNTSIQSFTIDLQLKLTLSSSTDQTDFDSGQLTNSVGFLAFAMEDENGNRIPVLKKAPIYNTVQYIEFVKYPSNVAVTYAYPFIQANYASVSSTEVQIKNIEFFASRGYSFQPDIADPNFKLYIYVEKPATAGTLTVYVEAVKLGVQYWIDPNIKGTTTAKNAKAGTKVTSSVKLPSLVGYEYGDTLSYDLKWHNDLIFGRDYGMTKLRVWRNPFSRLKLYFKWSNADIITEMLALDFDKQIKYKDTTFSGSAAGKGASYSDGYYYVEEIVHRIPVKGLPDTVVTLIPAYQYRNYDKIAWDDYNRSDTTNTTGSGNIGVSPTGDDWQGEGNTRILDAVLQLQSANTVTVNTAGFDLGSTNQIVECDVFTIIPSGTPSAGWVSLWVRGTNYNYNAVAATGYLIDFNFQKDVARVKLWIDIQKVSSGSLTSLYTADVRYFPNASGTYPYTIEFSPRVAILGSYIYVFIDDQLVKIISDTTYSSGNYVGMYLARATTSTTLKIDNFYSQGI